jgi:hypothetical protein
MDVLDELRKKRLSNSTFCTPVSNLNLKLESETVERIVLKVPNIYRGVPTSELYMEG